MSIVMVVSFMFRFRGPDGTVEMVETQTVESGSRMREHLVESGSRMGARSVMSESQLIRISNPICTT